MLYFCYIDESGTPEIPGNSSHYVLAGVSIPVHQWKYCDQEVQKIKNRYELGGAEIHTGWIARKYLEQSYIADFDNKSYSERRYEVERLRKQELYRLQKSKNTKHHKQTKKNYKQSQEYIHLSFKERMEFIREVADFLGDLNFVRIFAECIDKVHFDPERARYFVDEQGLEQVVSRF